MPETSPPADQAGVGRALLHPLRQASADIEGLLLATAEGLPFAHAGVARVDAAAAAGSYLLDQMDRLLPLLGQGAVAEAVVWTGDHIIAAGRAPADLVIVLAGGQRCSVAVMRLALQRVRKAVAALALPGPGADAGVDDESPR